MVPQDVIDLLTDEGALALTIYGEGRGEPVEGRIAIGCVVRNRVVDKRWADDYKGVVFAKQQFSCWNDGDPNRPVLEQLARETVSFDALDEPAVLRECIWIARGIITHDVLARVGVATHYCTTALYRNGPAPSWTRGVYPRWTIGNHVFFENVK